MKNPKIKTQIVIEKINTNMTMNIYTPHWQ